MIGRLGDNSIETGQYVATFYGAGYESIANREKVKKIYPLRWKKGSTF